MDTASHAGAPAAPGAAAARGVTHGRDDDATADTHEADAAARAAPRRRVEAHGDADVDAEMHAEEDGAAGALVRCAVRLVRIRHFRFMGPFR
jgi:hypothetical protein